MLNTGGGPASHPHTWPADRCSRIQWWYDTVAALVDVQAKYADGLAVPANQWNRRVGSAVTERPEITMTKQDQSSMKQGLAK